MLKNNENLRIQLLNVCDQNCFFCHGEGLDGKPQVIDEEIMWKTIDAAFALGRRSFSFTGGEPTLHPKLGDYITQLRGRGEDVEISLTTNGARLNLFSMELFSKLSKLSISLHSVDREEYQRITGKDCLSDVLENIAYVVSGRLKNLSVNMVVGKNNVAGVPTMVQYCREQGLGLKLLDIIGKCDKAMSPDEIRRSLGSCDVEFKAKNYYPKCIGCGSRQICGEGEYLRLGADSTLAPCLYRPDLVQVIGKTDSEQTIKSKVELGFRRLHLDDL